MTELQDCFWLKSNVYLLSNYSVISVSSLVRIKIKYSFTYPMMGKF